eukprot:786654-Prymnesium_polylepis.1
MSSDGRAGGLLVEALAARAERKVVIPKVHLGREEHSAGGGHVDAIRARGGQAPPHVDAHPCPWVDVRLRVLLGGLDGKRAAAERH